MATDTAPRHLFVVMGGTGDLMSRKLLPALWHLISGGLLPEPSVVMAVGRRGTFDDESYRAWAREALTEARLVNGEPDSWCDGCMYYHALGEGTEDDYQDLARRIEEIERKHNLPGNRVFYLALPPRAFVAAVESLGTIGLNEGPGWTRIVCEKPFGHDYDSAVELNRHIHQYFDETQTYRIDHYLGKETVRNLLAFRFANTIFESVWNRQHVGSVEIIVAEAVGVEGRGEFYDQTGTFRDMVQNHLSQLLTLTAMEAPPSLEADAIRDEKVKVLRSISPIGPGDVELGQYAAGFIDGEHVAGYLDEPGVAPGSTTETFVAMRVNIANWRWQGVPFLLRTGKRMPARTTQIAINFRCPVLAMFQMHEPAMVSANALVLTLQPDEGFDLRFEVKLPGEGLRLQTQSLSFKYADVFERLPEAYETLLLDVITGDQTLFVRADEVEESWRLYTPLLEAMPAPDPYAAGTLGPLDARRLMVPRGASCPI